MAIEYSKEGILVPDIDLMDGRILHISTPAYKIEDEGTLHLGYRVA